MQVMNHGGWCCGVKHLRGFGPPQGKTSKHTLVACRGQKISFEGGKYSIVDDPEKDYVDWKTESTGKTNEQVFVEAVTELKAGCGGGILEVILTDKFLEDLEHGALWAKKLKDAGFKLVSRFLNKNSSNVCNVFHLYKTDIPEGSPPNWE